MTSFEPWKDFFAASVGAASALAGLVFVALSINLDRILKFRGLTARSGETIVLLSAALFASLLGLAPIHSPHGLAYTLMAVALCAWGPTMRSQLAEWRTREAATRPQLVRRVLLHQLATLPLVVASVGVLAAWDGAPYALAIGIVLSLAVGLLNAWVLLVEIMR